MTVRTALDLLGLAVASVYCTIPLLWLVIHPFVDRWRSHGRNSFFFIMPIWALFIGAAFAAGWRFRHLHLYESWAAWIPGVLFILLGFGIYRAAFQGFDKAKVSGLAEIEHLHREQKLVVSGIREKVRHPIYLGHFCEAFGWCLGTGSLAMLVLLVFAVVTGAVMIRAEDDELERRFGEQYREYRRLVPAFLPRSH